MIWKLHRWICNIVESQNLYFTGSNWGMTPWKQPKIFEGKVDSSTVTRHLKKFHSGCKNSNNQTGLKVWMPSNTQRVSGERGHFHDLCKIIWTCWIVLHVTKILQNFCFSLIQTNNFFFFWTYSVGHSSFFLLYAKIP